MPKNISKHPLLVATIALVTGCACSDNNRTAHMRSGVSRSTHPGHSASIRSQANLNADTRGAAASAQLDSNRNSADGTDTVEIPIYREERDSAELRLHREQLQVGKREIPAGRVVLNKKITTEKVTPPVELRTEDVQIERQTAEVARDNNARPTSAHRKSSSP